MKVQAFPAFVFTLEVSIESLQALAKCSKYHYDSRCKAASQVGGFIFGWMNCVEWASDAGEPGRITATTSNLDVSLKIMELIGPLEPQEQQLIRDLRSLFAALLHKANALYNTCKTEFEMSHDGFEPSKA